MKKRTIALLPCIGALAAPAGASAMLSEIGRSPAAVVPSCPAKPCYAVSRTTGFQAKEGSVRGVDVIPADGRIVAWTITLSTPTPKQIKYFNKSLGTSSAQVTVVRPGRHLYYRVIAQGEPQDLEPYFGQTVQFALSKSIPVKKGMTVALTVPNWAPALAAAGVPPTTSWRASRSKGTCDDLTTQTSQTLTNNVTRFYCLYTGARLAYSATFVPDPTPNPGSTTTVKDPATTSTPTTPGASAQR